MSQRIAIFSLKILTSFPGLEGSLENNLGSSGIGSFINEILPFVVWKRGKYYLKVDKNGTSQDCPNCGAITGKKALSERVHRCDSCGHIEPRDTASAKVIENRGKNAVGLTVLENARGGDLTGIDWVKPGRSS
nr:zinc ribbon domain-containing protein [Microcystis sp. M090S1]